MYIVQRRKLGLLPNPRRPIEPKTGPRGMAAAATADWTTKVTARPLAAKVALPKTTGLMGPDTDSSSSSWQSRTENKMTLGQHST